MAKLFIIFVAVTVAAAANTTESQEGDLKREPRGIITDNISRKSISNLLGAASNFIGSGIDSSSGQSPGTIYQSSGTSTGSEKSGGYNRRSGVRLLLDGSTISDGLRRLSSYAETSSRNIDNNSGWHDSYDSKGNSDWTSSEGYGTLFASADQDEAYTNDYAVRNLNRDYGSSVGTNRYLIVKDGRPRATDKSIPASSRLTIPERNIRIPVLKDVIEPVSLKPISTVHKSQHDHQHHSVAHHPYAHYSVAVPSPIVPKSLPVDPPVDQQLLRPFFLKPIHRPPIIHPPQIQQQVINVPPQIVNLEPQVIDAPPEIQRVTVEHPPSIYYKIIPKYIKRPSKVIEHTKTYIERVPDISIEQKIDEVITEPASRGKLFKNLFGSKN